jgi:multicomponent Na+:H+ antiporter subunit B
LKAVGLITAICLGMALLYASMDFPPWADPQSPASVHLSPHYIEEAINETSVPNIVTAVLADYRGFDTMFETAVIFAAGIAVLLILRKFTKDDEESYLPELSDEVEPDIIVQTITRIIVPFTQLFALYVIAHGHHSPGGGFQGGVILGASFILLAISFSLKEMLQRFSERKDILLGGLGLLVYSGIGILCVILGENFLNYKALHFIIPGATSVTARSHGILGVEIGVALAVMAIMVAIYSNISSDGKYDKGL